MTIPMKVEINCATGAITERPLNDDELAQLAKDQKEAEKAKALADKEAKAIEDAKASAEAKLAKLGLSDDEVKAILG